MDLKLVGGAQGYKFQKVPIGFCCLETRMNQRTDEGIGETGVESVVLGKCLL